MFEKATMIGIGAAALLAGPALAQGIGHRLFMRGAVVGADGQGQVVCIGKVDGAKEKQVLDVYRVTAIPGPSKGTGAGFKRELVGHVRIDHIFNDHFAHVSTVDGKPAVHDLVELTKS
jgi:hypothetical protein